MADNVEIGVKLKIQNSDTIYKDLQAQANKVNFNRTKKNAAINTEVQTNYSNFQNVSKEGDIENTLKAYSKFLESSKKMYIQLASLDKATQAQLDIIEKQRRQIIEEQKQALKSKDSIAKQGRISSENNVQAYGTTRKKLVQDSKIDYIYGKGNVATTDTEKLTNYQNKLIEDGKTELADQVSILIKKLNSLDQELTNAYKKSISTVETSKEKLENLGTKEQKVLENSNGAESGVDNIQKTLDVSENLSENDKQLVQQKEKNIEETKKSADALDKMTDSQKKNTSTIGKAITSFFGYQMVLRQLRKLWNSAISTIKDLDKALTDQAIVSDLNREETWALVDSYQALAEQTGFTTTEIANVATKYFQQGKTVKEVMILTEAAAKSAKVAGISATDAVDYLTTAINGFQLSAEDALSVSDKFAALAATSATDYEELAIALSKVASQANLAGMSMDYTLGLLAKGVETTREAAESIGTALKTVIARMREISDYGETLEDGTDINSVEKQLGYIGIALRDTSGQLRSTEDVLDDLGRKWDTLNTNQQAAIAKALAGTRQQSRLIAMMTDYERTLELVQESEDSLGATNAQQAEYLQGMDAALNRLQVSYQAFITAITDSDVFINIINWIASVVQGITDIVNNTGGMIAIITSLVVVGGLLVASFIAQKIASIGLTKAVLVNNGAKLTGVKLTLVAIASNLGLISSDKALELAQNKVAISATAMWTAALGIAGVVIAAIAAVTVGIIALCNAFIDTRTNAERVQEEITELNNELYNTKKAVSSVQSLIDKYDELIAKLVKTKEEYEELENLFSETEFILFDANGNPIGQKDTDSDEDKKKAEDFNTKMQSASYEEQAAYLENIQYPNLKKHELKTEKEIISTAMDTETFLEIGNKEKREALDDNPPEILTDLAKKYWIQSNMNAGLTEEEANANYEKLSNIEKKAALHNFIRDSNALSDQEVEKYYNEYYQDFESTHKTVKENLSDPATKATVSTATAYLIKTGLQEGIDNSEDSWTDESTTLVSSWISSLTADMTGDELADFLLDVGEDNLKSFGEQIFKDFNTDDAQNALATLSDDTATYTEQLKAVDTLIKSSSLDAVDDAIKTQYSELLELQAKLGDAGMKAVDKLGLTFDQINNLNKAFEGTIYDIRTLLVVISENDWNYLTSEIEDMTQAQINAITTAMTAGKTITDVLNNIVSLASQVSTIRETQSKWSSMTQTEKEEFLQSHQSMFQKTDGSFDTEAYNNFVNGGNISEYINRYVETKKTSGKEELQSQYNAAYLQKFYYENKISQFQKENGTDESKYTKEQIKELKEYTDGLAGIELTLKSIESAWRELDNIQYMTLDDFVTYQENITSQIQDIWKEQRSRAVDIIGDIQDAFSESNSDLQKEVEDFINDTSNLESFRNSVSEAWNVYLETITDGTKEELEDQKDALEEEEDNIVDSLNRRKDAYSDYFDSLSELEDEQTYQEDRDKLIENISKLSGGTDATSQNKVAELKSSLADLEEERQKTRREEAQQAVLDSIDKNIEDIEDYYDKLIEDIDEKIDAIDTALEGINTTLDNIPTEITNAEIWKDLMSDNGANTALSYRAMLKANLIAEGKTEQEIAQALQAYDASIKTALGDSYTPPNDYSDYYDAEGNPIDNSEDGPETPKVTGSADIVNPVVQGYTGTSQGVVVRLTDGSVWIQDKNGWRLQSGTPLANYTQEQLNNAVKLFQTGGKHKGGGGSGGDDEPDPILPVVAGYNGTSQGAIVHLSDGSTWATGPNGWTLHSGLPLANYTQKQLNNAVKLFQTGGKHKVTSASLTAETKERPLTKGPDLGLNNKEVPAGSAAGEQISGNTGKTAENTNLIATYGSTISTSLAPEGTMDIAMKTIATNTGVDGELNKSLLTSTTSNKEIVQALINLTAAQTGEEGTIPLAIVSLKDQSKELNDSIITSLNIDGVLNQSLVGISDSLIAVNENISSSAASICSAVDRMKINITNNYTTNKNTSLTNVLTGAGKTPDVGSGSSGTGTKPTLTKEMW